MKTNFRNDLIISPKISKPGEVTELEFEEYVSKSGAAGSFMIFRSIRKDDEMGLEEL